jgi:hypothetical protein
VSKPKSDIVECIIKDCSNKVKARGLCHKHYKELILKSVCEVEDCKEKVHAKKLCYKHYCNKYKDELRNNKKPICYESSCNDESVARGLCRKHYYLAWKDDYLDLFPTK